MRAAFWMIAGALLVAGTFLLCLHAKTSYVVLTFVASLFFAYAAELQQGTRPERFAQSDTSATALIYAPTRPDGSLIVFRFGHPSKLLGMNLALNGRIFAQLKSPCFTRIDLPGGDYELSAAFCSYVTNKKSPKAIEVKIVQGQTTIVGIGVGLPERWKWWRILSKENWRDQIYMTIAPDGVREETLAYLAKIKMIVHDRELGQQWELTS